MAKRISLREAACPIARSMEAIGDCWSMLIVRNAMMGQRRFTEIQKSLGLAKNVLSDRLRSLVADGILETEPAADGSAYHDYVLTQKGRAIFPILVALRQWGEEFAFAKGEATNILVDQKSGKRVRRLEVQAGDGRRLDIGDTRIKTKVAD